MSGLIAVRNARIGRLVVKKAYRKGSRRDRRSSPSQDYVEQDHAVEVKGESEKTKKEENTGAAEDTFDRILSEDASKEAGEVGIGSRVKQQAPWLGYAFVVFRDEEEAAEAKAVVAASLQVWKKSMHMRAIGLH